MNDQTSSQPSSDKTTVGAIRDQVALISYIDTIIQEKEGTVEDAQLPQMRQNLLTELNDQINARLVSLLSDEQQDDLSDALDRNADDEVLDQFFVNNIPNLEVEIAAVLIDFRNAYLGIGMGDDTTEPQNAPEEAIAESATQAPQAEIVDDKTKHVLDSLAALAAEESHVEDSASSVDELMPAPPAPVMTSNPQEKQWN